MAQKSFRSWLLILAVLGASLDQVSKYGVFHWLQQDGHYDSGKNVGSTDVIPHAFKLYAQYSDDAPVDGRQPQVNQGALFGFLNEHKGVANFVFALVSVVAGVAIVIWSYRRTSPGDWLLSTALGLILAGTIGNLYDRIVFHGVRDFLYWYYKVNWPVFNVADCCLVCGAFLLLAQAFFAQPATEKKTLIMPAAAESLPNPEVARIN
ncbi:MAG TPA: signal peptidase II [Gemmataceae bacterium]|jgi:lipoprotein signal peptidase|nr:signal peptidase II [Gemmataceae bacterium]